MVSNHLFIFYGFIYFLQLFHCLLASYASVFYHFSLPVGLETSVSFVCATFSWSFWHSSIFRSAECRYCWPKTDTTSAIREAESHDAIAAQIIDSESLSINLKCVYYQRRSSSGRHFRGANNS